MNKEYPCDAYASDCPDCQYRLDCHFWQKYHHILDSSVSKRKENTK